MVEGVEEGVANEGVSCFCCAGDVNIGACEGLSTDEEDEYCEYVLLGVEVRV